MIDGISVELTGFDADLWLTNPLLKFLENKESKTNFKGSNLCAKYKGLHFSIWLYDKIPVRCTFRGSMHKFYNNGIHNADDFTYSKLLDTLNLLQKLFNINLNKAIIHRFEYGVNLQLKEPVNQFLNHLLTYKSNGFNFIDIRNEKLIIGKSFDLQLKRLKVYSNEFKNYDLVNKKSLRIEIKYEKMQGFKNDLKTLKRKGRLKNIFKVETLNDLKDKDKLKYLVDCLFIMWDEILFYNECIAKNKVSQRSYTDLLKFKNPNHWTNNNLNPNQKSRDKKRFLELIDKHGDHYKQDLTEQIFEKSKHLLE